MAKILLTKEDGLKQEVDIIRYFKYKNDYILIYTLNEFDEKNYQKLYVVKVLKELDYYIGYDINDNDEWKNMQISIKRTIKEIKNGKKKNINDLDFKDMVGIKITEPRSFKLDKKLVDILASNYKYTQPASENMDETDDKNIDIKNQNSEVEILDDYKNMYELLKKQKDASDLIIEDLLDKLIKYKEKYGAIE